MSIPDADPEITQLLEAWSGGDEAALKQLAPRVFNDLRRIASGHMMREVQGHTLQPTALVNEAFVRLLGCNRVKWSNRAHFFGAAAQLMRRVLVDHARRRGAQKRGGDVAITPLDEALEVAETRHLDIIALEDALKDLERLDPVAGKVVVMRFFGGLSLQEIAEAQGVSKMTVRRQWMKARTWLYQKLQSEAPAAAEEG